MPRRARDDGQRVILTNVRIHFLQHGHYDPPRYGITRLKGFCEALSSRQAGADTRIPLPARVSG